MFLGSMFFLLVPPLVVRHVFNRRLREEVKEYADEIPEIVKDLDELDAAIIAMIKVCVGYILGWNLVFGSIIFGALHLRDHEPELITRDYNRASSAAFITISTFTNGGIAISSGSLFYWKDNPLAYIAACFLILAGNTAIPCFLYLILKATIRTCVYCKWDPSPYQYILDNPNSITSHVLSPFSTKLLMYTIVGFNVIEYVMFLASMEGRRIVLEKYGSNTVIAGIGLFTSISTRTCGLAMMDLRDANQGMLVVWLILMYLSSFPFLGTIVAKEAVAPSNNFNQKFVMSVIGRHSFFITITFLIIAYLEDVAVLKDPVRAPTLFSPAILITYLN